MAGREGAWRGLAEVGDGGHALVLRRKKHRRSSLLLLLLLLGRRRAVRLRGASRRGGQGRGRAAPCHHRRELRVSSHRRPRGGRERGGAPHEGGRQELGRPWRRGDGGWHVLGELRLQQGLQVVRLLSTETRARAARGAGWSVSGAGGCWVHRIRTSSVGCIE